ncbi:YihY/virulence factor BrkB family protein [Pontibacter akesuensis]|uniref:Membrane protein n=1 Tax=Pontibacter akesuensis TaxID=388950 RepID=A0A1I7KLA1_9BACT|nr:YihY/virulence factor BrkB family protein [Pontibacter akesuensis]GHA78009.1 hypothetical protein GCM10007389_34830 [Pontibacter akesuensis]SFU98186.1 membrane protein [Pontibacter akesuensis]
MSFFKRAWSILKEVKRNFRNGEPVVHSAAIAFFTIFSLPAISIVITLIGSAFFSEDTVRKEIVKEVRSLVSVEASEQVNVVIQNALEVPAGFWGVLFGIVVVVQSSSIMFLIIQKALNAVWQVKPKRNLGILRIVKHRLITLGMVIGLGLLLTLSLLLDTTITMFDEQLKYAFEEYFSGAVRAINTVFYLLIVFVFFTAVLKILPDVKVSWKDALVGGLITSIFFLIGKEIINYVLGSIRIAGLYAAAGSLVVLLLWVFYSSVILLFGAEVTKAYASSYGRHPKPRSIAERINGR